MKIFMITLCLMMLLNSWEIPKYDEKLDGMVVSAAHIEPPIQTVLRFFDFPCREFYLPIVATIEASLLPSKCPQGTTTIPWHPGWGRPVSSLPGFIL
jgi:hypothetical protein